MLTTTRTTRRGGRNGTERVYTPEMEQQIRDLYPTMGRGLAKILGVKQDSLGVKAHKMGVKATRHGNNVSKAMRARNKTYNHAFFEKWSPELAYVLGYIWADGCIVQEKGKPRGVDFRCTEADRDVLDQIRAAVGSNREMRRQEGQVVRDTRPGRTHILHSCRPSIGFRIHSRNLAELLVREHGLAPRKSWANLPYPTNVPDELLSHFARGNLDGDGSIYAKIKRRANLANVCWIGSHRFIEGLASHISRVAGVRLPRMAVTGTLSKSQWTAKVDVLKLHEWVYKDATIYLKRKRDKFDFAAEVAK